MIRKELSEAQELYKFATWQRQIITLYYYENLTLREIGKIFDLSPQRITQIRKKALENIENSLRQSGFDSSFSD